MLFTYDPSQVDAKKIIQGGEDRGGEAASTDENNTLAEEAMTCKRGVGVCWAFKKVEGAVLGNPLVIFFLACSKHLSSE